MSLCWCHYAECHYAECRYAECHYANCRYAERRSALGRTSRRCFIAERSLASILRRINKNKVYPLDVFLP
jgi:hypothetical protein